MKNKLFIFILSTIISYCGYAQISINGWDIPSDRALSMMDSILGAGDNEEYKNYANNFFYKGEPDSLFQDMVLYSYVMAEKYGNTYAAYNCFLLLGGARDMPQDSSVTIFLLHLLEIGASGDTAYADLSEIGCAFYLAEWYRGNKFIKPDVIKQKYYMEKEKAMIRSRNRYLNQKKKDTFGSNTESENKTKDKKY